jgi:hypothetical protein
MDKKQTASQSEINHEFRFSQELNPHHVRSVSKGNMRYALHVQIGLCATCRHVKTLASPKASVFYMCMKSDTDPKFRRYPALPVLKCSGYEKADPTPKAK